MKNIQILLIFISLFFFTSCDKEEQWKKPTSVNFELNLASSEHDYIEFSSGSIMLLDFIVEGYRSEADDVFFTRHFSEPFEIDFTERHLNNNLNFDIPQGLYSRLNIQFETYEFEGDIDVGYEYIDDEEEDGEDDDEEEEEEEEEDDDEEEEEDENENRSLNTELDDLQVYEDTEMYSLAIEGTFFGEEDINLRFELYSTELFEALVKNSENNQEIVLDEDKASKVQINIDPIYWFKNIPDRYWDEAVIVEFNDEPTIVISEFVNPELFVLAAYRISNSIEIQIQ